jgi:hypothetical protein
MVAWFAWHGMIAWHGMAWFAWHGMVCMAWHGLHGMAWFAWHGMVCMAWHGVHHEGHMPVPTSTCCMQQVGDLQSVDYTCSLSLERIFHQFWGSKSSGV